MARRLHLDRLHAILETAYAAGARRRSAFITEWSIAGDCESPYFTEIQGRPERRPGDPRYQIVGVGHPTPQTLWLHTRCRRCRRCLRMRARRWFGGALRETKASTRTWFGTLTLSPEWQLRALSTARVNLAAQGVDFDCLDGPAQFLERHKAVSPELTKYIKRIRKESGAALRYLLVAEKHESGLPHYHMLVHEAPLGGTVSHRTLSTQWGLGFERWRLSDPQKPARAGYLCKYLSKSLQARVRASQGYGVTTSELHTYVSAQLRKVVPDLPNGEWNEVEGRTKF